MPALREKGGTVVWMKSFWKTILTNRTHSDTGHTAQDIRSHTETTKLLKMLLTIGILCLLFSPALLLDCYVCTSSTTNDACNQKNQTCQTIHDTCMTTVDILGSSKAIVKQCASKATCTGAAASAATDANGNGNIVTCCSAYNLCNFSAAESVHVQMTLLSLTAVLLVLLLK